MLNIVSFLLHLKTALQLFRYTWKEAWLKAICGMVQECDILKKTKYDDNRINQKEGGIYRGKMLMFLGHTKTILCGIVMHIFQTS